MHKENKKNKKEVKEIGDSKWAVDLINGPDQIKRQMLQAVRSKSKGLGSRGCMIKHALRHTGFQGYKYLCRTASLYFHCYFFFLISSFKFLFSFYPFFLYFIFPQSQEKNYLNLRSKGKGILPPV